MVVYKVVGCFGPFQQDVWPMMLVVGHKTLVKFATFSLKHSHRHLYSGILYLLYATSLNLGKRVYTPHNTSPYTFLYYKVGTRRRLTIMRARLKTNIYSCLMQQLLVLRLNRGKCIHLGMPFATTHMITFTDYSTIGCHYHRSNHRVRLSILHTVACQLQATVHKPFIGCHYCLYLF